MRHSVNGYLKGWVHDMLKDGAIAKIARERGGDAVILSGSSREFRDVDLTGTLLYDIKAQYKRITKFVVVKYLT